MKFSQSVLNTRQLLKMIRSQFGNNRKDFLNVNFITTNIFPVVQNINIFKEEEYGINIFVSRA